MLLLDFDIKESIANIVTSLTVCCIFIYCSAIFVFCIFIPSLNFWCDVDLRKQFGISEEEVEKSESMKRENDSFSPNSTMISPTCLMKRSRLLKKIQKSRRNMRRISRVPSSPLRDTEYEDDEHELSPLT